MAPVGDSLFAAYDPLDMKAAKYLIVASSVYLHGLPQDNTFGPLNTRSLTDVRRRARQLTPPARKGEFLTENKPNNKHHKMYRQFAKPPGQAPGEYSRDYPD